MAFTKNPKETCLFKELLQIISETSSAVIVKLMKEIVSPNHLDFKYLTIY